MLPRTKSHEMMEEAHNPLKQKENLNDLLVLSSELEDFHRQCNEAIVGDNLNAIQESIINYSEMLQKEIDRCLKIETSSSFFDAEHQEIHPLALRKFKETIISHIFSLTTLISFFLRKVNVTTIELNGKKLDILPILPLNLLKHLQFSLDTSRIVECVIDTKDIKVVEQENINILREFEVNRLNIRRRTVEQLLIITVAFPIGFVIGGPLGAATAVSFGAPLGAAMAVTFTSYSLIVANIIKKHNFSIVDLVSEAKMSSLQRDICEESITNSQSLTISAIKDLIFPDMESNLTTLSFDEVQSNVHIGTWDLLINQAVKSFEINIQEELTEYYNNHQEISEKPLLSVVLQEILDSFISQSDRLKFLAKCEKSLEELGRHLDTIVRIVSDENFTKEREINQILDSLETRVSRLQRASKKINLLFEKMKDWAVCFYFNSASCSQEKITLDIEDSLTGAYQENEKIVQANEIVNHKKNSSFIPVFSSMMTLSTLTASTTKDMFSRRSEKEEPSLFSESMSSISTKVSMYDEAKKRCQELAKNCDNLLKFYTEEKEYARDLEKSALIISQKLPGCLNKEKVQEANLKVLKAKGETWLSWQEKIIDSFSETKVLVKKHCYSPNSKNSTFSFSESSAAPNLKSEIIKSGEITNNKLTAFNKNKENQNSMKGEKSCIP